MKRILKNSTLLFCLLFSRVLYENQERAELINREVIPLKLVTEVSKASSWCQFFIVEDLQNLGSQLDLQQCYLLQDSFQKQFLK